MRRPIRAAGISKRVNVLTEPMQTQINEESKLSAIPAYTYVSPGSCWVQVMIKNPTVQPVTVGRVQVMVVVKPANEVPKMLVPNNTMIKTESGPRIGSRVSKPEEGRQDGYHVYLKQSIGDKLQLEEHRVGT